MDSDIYFSQYCSLSDWCVKFQWQTFNKSNRYSGLAVASCLYIPNSHKNIPQTANREATFSYTGMYQHNPFISVPHYETKIETWFWQIAIYQWPNFLLRWTFLCVKHAAQPKRMLFCKTCCKWFCASRYRIVILKLAFCLTLPCETCLNNILYPSSEHASYGRRSCKNTRYHTRCNICKTFVFQTIILVFFFQQK